MASSRSSSSCSAYFFAALCFRRFSAPLACLDSKKTRWFSSFYTSRRLRSLPLLLFFLYFVSAFFLCGCCCCSRRFQWVKNVFIGGVFPLVTVTPPFFICLRCAADMRFFFVLCSFCLVVISLAVSSIEAFSFTCAASSFTI